MEKDCEVFLVDHAWTFKFQDAFTTLNTNQALMERLKKIIEHKHKLPIAQAEETKEAKRDIQQVFDEELAKGGVAFNLDELGIIELEGLKFPEEVEEISLFNNEVINPNQVVKYLVPLPNLKALWLNNNPVVNACSNFNTISELMP